MRIRTNPPRHLLVLGLIRLLPYLISAGSHQFLNAAPLQEVRSSSQPAVQSAQENAGQNRIETWVARAQIVSSRIHEQAQHNESMARKAGGLESLAAMLASLEAEGSLRVIVGLRAGFQPEGLFRNPVEVRTQQAAIGEAQSELLSRMARFSVRAVKKYDSIPFLAMEVDAAGLQYLLEAPEVVTIQEDVMHSFSLATSVPLIGAPAAWAGGFTGAGQTVAILDTGVDKQHPFLEGKVVAEACFSTTGSKTTSVCAGGVAQSTAPGSGVPCSVAGCEHGTHVAGIAAGRSVSLSGVAKDANIIAIQVASSLKSCTSKVDCTGVYVSDVLLGLQQVRDLAGSFNIAAVNLSLGSGQYSSPCDSADPATKAAINNLRSQGIATIVASGNNGFTGMLSSPACISSVISVGSTGDGGTGPSLDVVSSFSNSASFLSLLAPGEWIDSSIPGGKYAAYRGTSQAAPHVAGAWAILKSKSPNASVSQVLSALVSTGVPVIDTRNNMTKPRLRVDAAADALSNSNCTYSISPATQSFNSDGGEGFLNLTAGSDCAWKAISNDSWIKITNGSSGSGEGVLRFSAEANNGVDRVGTLLIAGETVIVTQKGIDALSVDDGSFENFLSLVDGYAVNRLTPNAYPATVNAVAIYFPSAIGVKGGTLFEVVAGSNPSGSSNIDGIALQRTQATVQALDQFSTYSIPGITANSGDIVVGIRLKHAAGLYPFSIDTTPPYKGRSYNSFNGTTFISLDKSESPGNLGIRALLAPALSCPNVTDINPASAPAGSSVTITGTGFTGVTAVRFSSNISSRFTIDSDAGITATVPDEAVAGPIILSSASCGNVQTRTFTPISCAAIAPTSLSFEVAGGTGSIAITANGNCNWTARSNDDWVTIASGSNGSGSGAVNLTVAANTKSADRIGTMAVGNQLFTVRQKGLGCTARSIAPGQVVDGMLTNGCTAYSGNTYADRYTFSGTSGQSVAIRLVSTEFSTALSLRGSNGTVIASRTSSNSSYDSSIQYVRLPANDNYIIEATSMISNTTGNYTLAFVSGAAGCNYGLSPFSQSIGVSGGAGSVSVSTGSNCGWQAASTSKWIAVDDGKTGTGAGTIKYSVAANDSKGPRTGTMVIGDNSLTINQAGCVSLTPDRQDFGVSGGTGSIKITTVGGCSWSVTSNDQAWVTITGGSSGNGDGTVNYAVAANSRAVSRSGSLSIAGQTFTVNQSGCISIAPTSEQGFNAEGGNGTIQVTTAGGCGWTTRGSQSWITLAPGSSGSSSGTVRYTVAANNDVSARRGALDFGTGFFVGLTVTINQAGAGGTCAPMTIAPGQTIRGALTKGDCSHSASITPYVDRYTFNGTNGQSVAITMASSEFSTYLRLLDPDGKRIGSDYSRIPLQTGFLKLPASGNYIIEATSFFTATGNYTLALVSGTSGCTYSLSPASQSIGANGGTGSVSLTAGSNCNWQAVSAADWITISEGNTGAGNGTIKYSVAVNGSTTPRTGTLLIGDKSFAVTQAGCASIAPSSQGFNAEGGTGNIQITTVGGCGWSANSSLDWVTITAGSSGSGDGTVRYTVAANSAAAARSGTLSIAGQTFTIRQGGIGGTCVTLPIAPGQAVSGTLTAGDCLTSRPYNTGYADRYAFTGTSGQPVAILIDSPEIYTSVNLMGPDGTLIASGSFGGGSNNSSRIPGTSGFSSLPVNGSYIIEATSLPNATGNYTLAMTLGTAGCTYSLPYSQSIGANGGMVSVGLTTGSNCNWQSASTSNWITITDGNTGTGNGTIKYSVAVNSSTSYRQGAMVIGNSFLRIEQAPAPPCPMVSSISPAVAAPGAWVTLTGTNFFYVTGVRFSNNLPAASFNTINSSQMTARVPDGTVTGPITLSSHICSDIQTSPLGITKIELYFPRLVSTDGIGKEPDDSEYTGIGLVNLDNADGILALTAYDKNGALTSGSNITNPAALNIKKGAQLPTVDLQVFGAGLPAKKVVGWMKVESSISRLVGFFLAFNKSLSILDGADISTGKLTSFILPEIEEQGFTQIHIANPDPGASNQITFNVIKADGTPRISGVVRNLSPNGALAEFFTDLFPGIVPAGSDYMRVNSTSPKGMVPLEFFGKPGLYVAGLNGQDIADGAVTLYCPQYVIGPGYRTALSVINLDAAAGTVSLRFIRDDGTQAGATRQVPIAAQGKINITDQKFFIDAGSTITQGYLELSSSGPKLGGSVVFGDPERTTFSAALPLVSKLRTAMIFSQVASNATYFTGMSVLNPNASDANAILEVFDRNGVLIRSRTLLIKSRQRISQVLAQYFPDLIGQDISSGYFKLTADKGVASFAVFGTNNLSVLSAVPPQVVP